MRQTPFSGERKLPPRRFAALKQKPRRAATEAEWLSNGLRSDRFNNEIRSAKETFGITLASGCRGHHPIAALALGAVESTVCPFQQVLKRIIGRGKAGNPQ